MELNDKQRLILLQAENEVLKRQLDVSQNDVKLIKLAARKLVAWVAVTTLKYGLTYPAGFIENVLIALRWTDDSADREAA